MEIDIYAVPNAAKLGVTLKVCLDRRWKSFPVGTVFDAVEEFNRILQARKYQREVVKQPDLWGGRNLDA